MARAIGNSLPMALAVAISPVPVVAVILMLLSRRAGANSAWFLLGWVAGIALATVVVVAIAEVAPRSPGRPAAWVSWLRLLLGVTLLAVGLRNWRRRVRAGREGSMPRWLSAVESFTPARAAGLGLLLPILNPKDLLLIIAGAVAIAQGAIGGTARSVATVVFVLICASTVIAPVVLYVSMGDRAGRLLTAAKTWLTANNATVIATMVLVISSVLIGRGIAGLG